jgi:hypothetical protein
LEDVDRLSEHSELSSEAGDDSNPRSEDVAESKSEDRNNARSDEESNPESGGHNAEEEEEEEYRESGPLPTRVSFHEDLGMISLCSDIA